MLINFIKGETVNIMKNKQTKIKSIKFLILILVSFAAMHAASEGEIEEGSQKPLSQQELTNRFASLGHDWAIKSQIGGCSIARPDDYINSLVGRGSEAAISKKIRWLKYRVDKTDEKLKDCAGKSDELLKKKIQDEHNECVAVLDSFIEEQVLLGSEAAIGKKIQGLREKMYGHAQGDTMLHSFIEEQVGRRSEVDIENKIQGLRWNRYGYAQDDTMLHSFIEEQVSRGSEAAIDAKLKWCQQSYDRDSQSIIDCYVKQGNKTAINIRITGFGGHLQFQKSVYKILDYNKVIKAQYLTESRDYQDLNAARVLLNQLEQVIW